MPKSLPVKNISVIKSVLVLFPNRKSIWKALNFNTVQSTWPPPWISEKVLINIYDVINHVQS